MITDSTIARIAGNIAAGIISVGPVRVWADDERYLRQAAKTSVVLAHLIVEEVEAEQEVPS